MSDFSTGLSAKIESERIVLSAIFIENELIKDSVLIPANFFMPKHQEIFSAMKSLDEKGKPIEPILVFEEVGIKKSGLVGGLSYILELHTTGFSTSSFVHHQDLILGHYKQRKIVEALQIAMSDALEHESDTVVEDLMKNLSRIEEQTVDDNDGHIKKVLLETADWMETDHGEISGAPTGFKDLDKLTGGLQRQDLVIVGGRPSMGKTAFSVGACLNYAEDKVHGGPAVLFSLEMRNHALALRMISNIAHINGQSMFNPFHSFTGEEWSRSTNAFGQLGNLPMHMFDEPGINVAYIRNKLRLMQRLYPGQHVVVMIDYLQIIQGDPKHKGNRTQEISDISRSLKRLAREMDMTIIVLSQLSRSVESRQDKRPMLSDLRESGQLEQDADVICFLYRDDYYDKESELKNLVEIIVAKQRNGPIGTVFLAFVKEYSKFVNIIK